MNTHDIRYVYLRDGKNDTTIAYRYDDARQAIEFNVARRNKRDHFVKSVGREVASGRLLKNGGYLIPYAAIEAFAEDHNAHEARLEFLFGIDTDFYTNMKGYRAIAAFFHSQVRPDIQPYDKHTMFVVTTKSAAGEHEGFVVVNDKAA